MLKDNEDTIKGNNKALEGEEKTVKCDLMH